MKLNCEKELLESALDIVSKVRSKKEDSILSNVFLEVNDKGELIFTSQDEVMLIQNRQSMTSMDFEKGDVLLSSLAIDIIKKLPKGEITLEKKDNILHILSGKIKNKVSIQTGDYPTPETETDILAQVNVKGEDLVKLEKVLYAAAVVDTRPVLTCVNIELSDDKIFMTALDGYRLARTEIKADIKKSDTKSVLISAAKIQPILKMFANAANVTINITKSYCYIITPQSVVALKTFHHGEYPNVYALMRENPKKLKVKKDVFLQALERTLVITQKNNPRMCVLAINHNAIKITSKNEYGETEEDIECNGEGFEDEFKIAFNTDYLVSALKNTFNADIINLELDTNVGAMYIKADQDFVLALPIRITDGK